MPKEINPPVGGEEAKTPAILEPKINVMPARFLGVESGARPIGQVATTNALIKKKFPLVPVIIAGVIVMAVGGGITYYFLSSSQKPIEVAKKEEPKVVIPSIIDEEEEEEVATSTPEEVVEFEPIIEIDSDGDGLTDTEEGVYLSQVSNPDTDGDEHLDGHEVFHLFDPTKPTPALLKDSGLVKTYVNNQFGYEIYHPADWLAQVVDLQTGDVIINTGTGEFIEITVEENKNKLPITSWYVSQAPGVRVSDLETFVAKSGLDGIKSPDRLTTYFTKSGLVYIISYGLGQAQEVYYSRTFEMMLNSFKILN